MNATASDMLRYFTKDNGCKVVRFPRDAHSGQARVAMDGTTVSKPDCVEFELMAISLSDILASLQNGVTAINGLRTQVRTTFPQRGEFSTAARGSLGAVTLDASQAIGFMPVTTSSGFIGYVAIYPSS